MNLFVVCLFCLFFFKDICLTVRLISRIAKNDGRLAFGSGHTFKTICDGVVYGENKLLNGGVAYAGISLRLRDPKYLPGR